MPETLPPEPTNLDQILSHGYTIADPNYAPSTSRKHGFAKLERDGQLYFGKYSLDDTRRQSSIEADVWWCDTMAHIDSEQSLAIHTPRIINHGTGWYVAEWIEGQPSAALDSAPSALNPLIPRFTKYLAQLDSVDSRQLPQPPHASSDQTLRKYLEEHLWDEWCSRALEAGFLTPSRIVAARQIVDDFNHYLTPRLQHGDFVPWHILVDNQSTWWLIDGEHASSNKPRYLDLAYMYSRIFTYMHGQKQAAQLLKDFCNVSGQHLESFYPALLPVMTSRAIGMHFDAVNDLHATDYRAEAQDLLTRCLSRDPAALFQ